MKILIDCGGASGGIISEPSDGGSEIPRHVPPIFTMLLKKHRRVALSDGGKDGVLGTWKSK